jgi:lipoprotein-anchoring transpeptidase ErfK/SrfK
MLSLLLSFMLIGFMPPALPDHPIPLSGDPFIVVNKLNNQVAYIDDDKVQDVYLVATGKNDMLTPEGLFTVTVKAVNPYYRKKNIPGGDPENPLGTRWIGFNARGTDGRIYGIHGTNQPTSIGKYISNGCIRVTNIDVEQLYNKVPIGTKILIIKSTEDFTTIANNYGAIS